MQQSSWKMDDKQQAMLEHYAAIAVKQKQVARASKKKFAGGWTPLGSWPWMSPRGFAVGHLLAAGYIEARETDGARLVRISRAGVEALEAVRGGEVIYA